MTRTGEAGKVAAVARTALVVTQKLRAPSSGPRWPTDCRQNAEVGTCRAFAGVTLRPSAKSGPFCTAWAAASDFTSLSFLDDLTSSFQGIAPSSLSTVVSGTVTRTAGLRIRPKATSTSGRGNSARTSTGIAGPLRRSSNLAGVSSPSGNVRFKHQPGSALACRGFFACRVHHSDADVCRRDVACSVPTAQISTGRDLRRPSFSRVGRQLYI